MDNTEFVERLEEIAVALGKCPSELFKASKPGVSGEVRTQALDRAKLQLKEYEEFLPSLSEGRREAAATRCRKHLENIRTYMQKLEEMK